MGDIVAWLPNPEQDLKSPAATPEDVFWSFVGIFIVMVALGIYRKFSKK